MIHDTQSAQISQKQDEHNIFVIMKTMYSSGYHHNGFMATHALRHMMCVTCHTSCAQFHGCQEPIVGITGRVHCFYDYTHTDIYIYIYIYIYINTHTILYTPYINLLHVYFFIDRVLSIQSQTLMLFKDISLITKVSRNLIGFYSRNRLQK